MDLCIRGDGQPQGRSREGCATVLCSDHVHQVEALEDQILTDLGWVDHDEATVSWTFSHGVGIGVG
jgi:hypothetical protein